MNLDYAQQLATELVEKLQPFAERIEVAGSIRRRQPHPKDIDIILIPKNQGLLAMQLKQIFPGKLGLGGKIIRGHYKAEQVDIYIAARSTWATLLLIRTGSARHNRMLATMAQRKGWHLHADGRGLFDALGNRVAGNTEESIFETLGLPYKEPEERE